jgi:hypothetical protein
MFLGPDSQEAEVICGVKVPYRGASLSGQLLDQTGILDRRGVVKRGTNWDT